MSKTNIIAIDPGLKALGLAVLDKSGAVRYVDVLTTSADRSLPRRLKKIETMLDDLLRVFEPEIMLLEATWRCDRASFRLAHQVARVCRRAASRRGIRVFSIPAVTVRQSITGYGWSSKAELATVVCSRYPHLRVYRGHIRAWKDRYFQNMFDAVALGLYYLDAVA